MDKNEAINKAIDEAIRHDILTDYLRKHRAELLDMTFFEYNEEMHIKAIRDEAFEDAGLIIKSEPVEKPEPPIGG